MQALQKFAITAVFSLTCFTVPVMSVAAADAIPNLGSGTGSGLGTGNGTGTGPGQVVPPIVETPVPGGSELGVGGSEGSASNAATVPGGPGEVTGGGSVSDAQRAESTSIRDVLEKAFKDKNRAASELLKEKLPNKVSDRIRQERLKIRTEKQAEVVSEQGTMARKALLDVSFEELKKGAGDHTDLLEAAKEQLKDRGKEARERRDLGGK
jgi:hypothetical protein